MAAPFKERHIKNGIVFKRPFNCHAVNLLKALNSTRLINGLSDGYVIVAGEKIPVQRNVLASASPYFRMLFNYSESGSNDCHLHNVSKETFQQLLDYVYTAEITLSDETVQDILQAADMLLFSDIKEICCEYLLQHITSANCIGILELAERLSCQLVYHKAQEYLQHHFKEVCLFEEFFKLSFNRLQEILKLDALCVSSEKEVLNALLSWINYDKQARLSFAETLLKDCLYTDLSKYGTDWLLTELHKKNPCIDRLLSYDSRIRGLQNVLLVAGGLNKKNLKQPVTNLVQCVPFQDLQLDSTVKSHWITLAPMLTARIYHCIIEAGGFLYVVGGQDQNGKILNSGEKYDPHKNQWVTIPPMKDCRYNFGLVAVDNKLYAIGGENKNILVSMEEFDIYTQTWRCLPNMKLPRNNPAIAAAKYKIYVCGGSYLTKYHESVECFDIKSETWESAPPMLERRCLARAINIDDALYVIGGFRPFECHSQISHRMLFCMNEVFFADKDCWQPFPSHINMFNCAPHTLPLDGLLTNGRNIFMIGNVYDAVNKCYHYMYTLNLDNPILEWTLLWELGPVNQVQASAVFIKLPKMLLDTIM